MVEDQQIIPMVESKVSLGRVEIRATDKAIEHRKTTSALESTPLFGSELAVYIDGEPIAWEYLQEVTLHIQEGEWPTFTIKGLPKT